MTSTTTLIAEPFISGVMALVWLVLGSVSWLGVGWTDVAFIRGWETPLGVVAIALAYTLGVLVDEAADQLLKGWGEHIKNEHQADGLPNVMHLRIAVGSTRLNAWFDYARSRIRVCRSAALNFLLITFAGVMFATTHPKESWPHGRAFCTLSIALAGLSLSCLVWAGWRWSTQTFYKMYQRGPELVKVAHQHADEDSDFCPISDSATPLA